jgi:ABC-type antimicrobial peptide transport system permease subunit
MYTGSSVRLKYNWDASRQSYGKSSWVIPVIDTSLEGNILALDVEYKSVVVPPPSGNCMLIVHPFNDSSGNNSKEFNVNVVDQEFNELSTHRVSFYGSEHIFFDQDSYPYGHVSEELYYQIYDKGSSQMAVYIDDYVHTDEVLRQISKAGNYVADSAFRLSRSGYDKVKEQNRKQVLFSAVFSLFILGVGTIILVNALLYLRKRDYETLINMGMNRFRLWRITIYELLLYTLAALAFTTGLVLLLYANPIESLMEYMKYFEARHYGYSGIYFMIVIGLTILIYYTVLLRMVRPRRKSTKKA